MPPEKKLWIAPEVQRLAIAKARELVAQALELLEANGRVPGAVIELRAILKEMEEAMLS